MRLYPGVYDTLQFLKNQRCVLIGYTESMGFYSNYRLRKLGLDELLDFVYSPPDHALPASAQSVRLELYTNHEERLKHTRLKHTPEGELKPNPGILKQIVSDLHASTSECIYVGDSLMKDIAMAQQACIDNAWAKYGAAQDRPEYELLRKVTHWPSSAVETERGLSQDDVAPTKILEKNFGELLSLFNF